MSTDSAALANKMKLGAATRPAILGGPEGLRDGLAIAVAKPIAATVDDTHDWILFFAPDRASLEAQLPAAEAALDRPGTLWIGYYKGSSKRQTDLTRNIGWDALKETNLMWLTRDLDRRSVVRVLTPRLQARRAAAELPVTHRGERIRPVDGLAGERRAGRPVDEPAGQRQARPNARPASKLRQATRSGRCSV